MLLYGFSLVPTSFHQVVTKLLCTADFQFYRNSIILILGPKGLPLLGCLLSVSQWHPGCSFMGLLELYYRYGPVCGFYIGPQPVISISGYEACKEAFMNENLNGRPDNGPARMKSKGKRMGIVTESSACTHLHHLLTLFSFSGVMLVDGDFLTIQKRFTLHHLRDFGFGRQNMESLVSKEVAVLLADMKRQFHDEGNVFEFKNYFNISLVNALWVMLASTRFERDDPRLKSLVELFDVVFRSGDIVRVAFPCPAILMKLFPAVFAKLGRMDLLKEVWKFIEVRKLFYSQFIQQIMSATYDLFIYRKRSMNTSRSHLWNPEILLTFTLKKLKKIMTIRFQVLF